MNLRSLRTVALFALFLGACSNTNGGNDKDAGPAQAADGGVSTNGGMDFTFSGNTGANTMRTQFQVGPVLGSFCMASGSGASKSCSFTANIYFDSCSSILNVAFVGVPMAGASFPFVADAPVPDGKGYLTYSETCGSVSKTWRATGGTIHLDSVTPPAQGLTTGTMSFTVTGGTMAPAKTGPGTAVGTFNAEGSSKEISYTGT